MEMGVLKNDKNTGKTPLIKVLYTHIHKHTSAYASLLPPFNLPTLVMPKQSLIF